MPLCLPIVAIGWHLSAGVVIVADRKKAVAVRVCVCGCVPLCFFLFRVFGLADRQKDGSRACHSSVCVCASVRANWRCVCVYLLAGVSSCVRIIAQLRIGVWCACMHACMHIPLAGLLLCVCVH